MSGPSRSAGGSVRSKAASFEIQLSIYAIDHRLRSCGIFLKTSQNRQLTGRNGWIAVVLSNEGPLPGAQLRISATRQSQRSATQVENPKSVAVP
jgi:hypothetical protein